MDLLLARLLAAKLAAFRNPTPETIRLYEQISSTIERLKSQETSLVERLRLLDHLAASGWSYYPDWPDLRRRWLLRSPEFSVGLSDEDVERLHAAGAEGRRAQVRIVRRWTANAPVELRSHLIEALSDGRPAVAWVASGVWIRDDEVFSRWLLARVGYPCGIQDGDDGLTAAVRALMCEPPAGLRCVIAYLVTTARNRRIDARRSQQLWDKRHDTDQADIDKLEQMITDERAIEELVDREMKAKLTPRQLAIVLIRAQSDSLPNNREVGESLGVSSSVVERDLSDIRRRLGCFRST